MGPVPVLVIPILQPLSPVCPITSPRPSSSPSSIPRLLTTYYSLLTTHYSLLTTNYLTTYYLLLTTYCLLLTASLLLATYYMLLTTCYILLAAYYMLFYTKRLAPLFDPAHLNGFWCRPGAFPLDLQFDYMRSSATHARVRDRDHYLGWVE